MKFDKARGIWKDLETAVLQTFEEDELEDDIPEREPVIPDNKPKLKGRCVLSIKIEDELEYEKWKEYNPGRKWEFIVSYPALMRAEYRFVNSMDVEILVKKVVQLLQMGFNVYSAQWLLEEESHE